MELLGDILRQCLHDLGIDKPLQQFEAIAVWSAVVGERIAAVTEAKRIHKGRLFVEVKNAAWRYELIFHRADLVEKLNQRLGGDVVKEIVLI
jgi:hypothetical protein